ncbi:MAG: GNAT family N-acetyltransferase [Micropruina sp.]
MGTASGRGADAPAPGEDAVAQIGSEHDQLLTAGAGRSAGRVRHPSGDADDVAALLRLIRGDQRSATGEATLGEDEITAWFDSARARDRADMLIVLRGGEPVGLWRVVRNFDDVYWVSVAADRSLPGAELDAV